jgi:hypothetical protein
VQTLTHRSGPFLLGCRDRVDEFQNGESEKPTAELRRKRWQDLPPHEDEAQVELDVNRSFIYYPTSMLPPSVRLETPSGSGGWY